MTEQPYNGSTVLVKKIESLLGEKKLSTPVAVRMILELQLEAIKQDHVRDEEIAALKKKINYSWGVWMSDNPRKAFAIIMIIYGFAISDIRKPVMDWIAGAVKLIISAL